MYFRLLLPVFSVRPETFSILPQLSVFSVQSFPIFETCPTFFPLKNPNLERVKVEVTVLTSNTV